MKRIAAILLIAALGISSGFAEEYHDFTSADGSKTFRGALMGYDADSQAVQVRHHRGRIMRFKISILSDADQEFVKSKAPLLAAAKGLRIDPDMNRKKAGSKKSGGWICEKTTCDYDVSIDNTRANDLGMVEFEYAIFIERNRRDAKSVNEMVTGSYSVSSFIGNGNEFFTTSPITLESWSDNPPIPKGGGGGGG